MVIAGEHLAPGSKVLDFGGGANPIIPPGERPPGCTYVGLDVSREELDRAPAGSYDDKVAGTIESLLSDGNPEFDLIVSWQVLEHVSSMAETLAGIRDSLKDGGLFVGQLSGRWAAYAVLNRLIPDSLGEQLMQRLLDRDPESVFRAHYDRCTYSGLMGLAGGWSEFEVIPRYRGAVYLGFSRPLAGAYLRYEDWAIRHGRSDLATHYIVRAVR